MPNASKQFAEHATAPRRADPMRGAWVMIMVVEATGPWSLFVRARGPRSGSSTRLNWQLDALER